MAKQKVLTPDPASEQLQTARSKSDIERLEALGVGKLVTNLKACEKANKRHDRDKRHVTACVSGTLRLEMYDGDVDVPIAGPNGAAAGTFKKLATLVVKNAKGEIVDLLDGIAPTLTPGKTVADGDVGNPTITGTPKIVEGRCLFEVVFDTDAGSTKNYAADDEVTVDCDLTVCNIALTQITQTFTLVA
jgi:hypothetical protein